MLKAITGHEYSSIEFLTIGLKKGRNSSDNAIELLFDFLVLEFYLKDEM